MSRGRGGPFREHFQRHPPPDPQVKDHYHEPGQASFYPRPVSKQTPYQGYYQNPAHPVVPTQAPAPFHTLSVSPIPAHNIVPPKPAAHNFHKLSDCPSPAPNSFQAKQVEFLRGQSSEAPQFRVRQPGSGPARLPIPSYHHKSGYNRYPNHKNSPRGRGCQSFQYSPSDRAPKGTLGSQQLNQNLVHGHQYNLYSNRQWSLHTDVLSENIQSLTLHQDGPKRGGEKSDRYLASSSLANFSFNRSEITLTTDIQDNVLRALKRSEGTTAKLLAKKFRLPKKIVNKALYSLERSNKASKQGLHPPEWTLYKEQLRFKEDPNSNLQSLSSDLCLDSEYLPDAKVELKTDAEEPKEDDTDTYCSLNSSSESSDSEESQSLSKGHNQEKQHSSKSSDQKSKPPTMSDHKEQVLQYLLKSGEANALSIAKNLGFRTAKQINPTLYALEKQGEVIKNKELKSPTWELSTHRRVRIERSLKAAQSIPVEGNQMELESRGAEEIGASTSLLSPPQLPMPGLEQQSHSKVVGEIISIFSSFIFLY